MTMRFNLWSSTFVIVFIGFQHVLAQDNSVACETSRGEKGSCINIKNCPSLLEILRTQGRAAGDYLRSTLCGYDGRDPRVCCPQQGRNNNAGDADNLDAEEPVPSKYGPLKPPYCGLSNDSHTRVVGGIPARKGAWPWIASLGYLNKANPRSPKFLCGGTLISSRHVLTAAHCVYRRNDIYMVRIADLDLQRDNDGAKPINVGIERITIHPNYSPTVFTNDIAMLRLRSEVPFSDLLHPICLPVSREVRNINLDNALPFIAGFGAIGYGGPSSSVLLETQVPIVKIDKCRNSYATVSNTIIDDRVLCAGYAKGGKDACQGDSGGPLVFPDDEVSYLIGVVSYGYKCAEPGFPGVYTKVSAFMDFIVKHLV